MDIVTYAQALLLGVVEGLTEFIPVSSTGHLILLVDILGFAGPPGKVFEIVIQLGAICAVCWLFRMRLWQAAMDAPYDERARRFIRNIVIAFLPSAVLGATLHGFIKEVLFSPYVVSVTLITGGLAIIWIEKHLQTQGEGTGYSPSPQPSPPVGERGQTASPHPDRHPASNEAAAQDDEESVSDDDIENFSWKLALAIGFCQTLAMIPGISRSGATIMGALLLGVGRKTATEFSFFLAIPTMFGATVYDIYKNREILTVDSWGIIAVGFVSAALVGGLVVGGLIRFIQRHGFLPFAFYRIAIGAAMLALLSLR